MSYPDLVTYKVDDRWATLKPDRGGMPMVLRIRDHLRLMAGHPKLPKLLRVTCPYESDDSGHPSSLTAEQMDQIETCRNPEQFFRNWSKS